MGAVTVCLPADGKHNGFSPFKGFDAARFDFHHPGGIFWDGSVYDGVDFGRAFEIPIEPGQNHLVSEMVILELKRTGTHRLLPEVLSGCPVRL
jgi:hypothetical protein